LTVVFLKIILEENKFEYIKGLMRSWTEGQGKITNGISRQGKITNGISRQGKITNGISRQGNVIKFVSHLRQVGSFLRVLRFPPPIKLTTTGPRYN
jgi:hypothetical protein